MQYSRLVQESWKHGTLFILLRTMNQKYYNGQETFLQIEDKIFFVLNLRDDDSQLKQQNAENTRNKGR